MKVLNPDAQEFMPSGLNLAFAPKAGKQANTITIPIKAEIGVPRSTIPVIAVGRPEHSSEGALPAPNGLAELATCLSDNLTFEDMFDHGSRQNSVSNQNNHLT